MERHTKTGNQEKVSCFFAPIFGIFRNRRYYAVQRGIKRNSLSRLANSQAVRRGQAKENPTCFVWQFSIFGGVGTEREMKKFMKISVNFALCGVVGIRMRNVSAALAKSPLAVLKVLTCTVFCVRSWFFAPFRSHRGFWTLPNKQFLTDRAGRNTEKGTLFLCLLRKFFLLSTTPKNPKMTDFHKRKTLQPKKIATLPKSLCNFAGQCLFSLTLCDLLRRGGDYPYSCIAHIVQQSVKLPPLGIFPGGLLQKELIYSP